MMVQLPIFDFLKLQEILTSGQTKLYTRIITGVVRKNRGSKGGQVVLVRYEPIENGKFEDSGEVPTDWTSNPVAMVVGQIAKESIGKRCLIFQINKDKEKHPPNGYRELAWIQCLEE